MGQHQEAGKSWESVQSIFEQELAWGVGLAASSMRVVRYELAKWIRWLKERRSSWRDVTADDLRAWLASAQAHQADKTVDKRIWVLRRFYRWAHLNGLINHDPWQSIARPAQRRAWQPRFTPSNGAVSALLAQPDTLTMTGIRDRAILELLYSSGLRASEIIALNCHQISADAKERCIRVMGKGQRERLVIYGEHAATWLQYYARVARRELLRKAKPVEQFFVNDTISGALTYPVMRRVIKRYALAAGLPLLTAHSLRHAFATHMYQSGASIRVIQMLLGHSMLETTAAYMRTSTVWMRELIERHHPRGSLYLPPQSGSRIGVKTASLR